MKLIKSQTFFDGRDEDRDVFIGFEGNEITYVGNSKQDGELEFLEEEISIKKRQYRRENVNYWHITI